MANLDIANLKDNNPYLQKIKKALEREAKQSIVLIDFDKVKRVAGVSARPVIFVFTDNQKLTLYVRTTADVFKAELNGKALPLRGDFNAEHKDNFDAGVKGAAIAVRDNEKKFLAQQAKIKVTPPVRQKKPSTSPSAQLKVIAEQEAVVDKEIADLTAQRDALANRLSDVQ